MSRIRGGARTETRLMEVILPTSQSAARNSTVTTLVVSMKLSSMFLYGPGYPVEKFASHRDNKSFVR